MMNDSAAFLLVLALAGGGLVMKNGTPTPGGDQQKPLPSKPQHRLIRVKADGDDVIYRVENLVFDGNSSTTSYSDEQEMYVIGNADKSSFVTANAGTISLELVKDEERVDAMIFNTVADAEAFLSPPADDPSGPQKQPEEKPELPPVNPPPTKPMPPFGGESSYGF